MPEEELKHLFDDLLGQDIAIALLEATLRTKRIAPAYLFSGPKGVGQSLATLRFLEGLITGGVPSVLERNRLKKINHPDLIWVEPTYINQGELVTRSLAEKEAVKKRSQPQIRLEQIKELQRFLGKKPIETKLGMVVIEDVESMNESASNCLLKTLEEPTNGILILISHSPERLLPTIRSRCQTIPFSSLKQETLEKVISKIRGKDDNFSMQLNEKELIMLSNGSPGELISNFKALQELPEEIIIRIKKLPKNPLEALALSRDIADTLDIEQQLWLINWLQQYVWDRDMNTRIIKRLEVLRTHLNSFVQPRLAWEVTLLKIAKVN